MGFSWTKFTGKLDPGSRLLSKYLRKHHLNYGRVVTGNWRKWLNGESNSAKDYQTVNAAYGVANDYKLDTRYRSLAELTGTK